MKYYEIRELGFQGMSIMLGRTGWSGEIGYEIFLRDSQFGDEFRTVSWRLVLTMGLSLLDHQTFDA